MSNSKLVSYTALSPHYNPRGKNKILKITPHHMAGNLSVETCGKIFANPKRNASSNYGIGSDGRIAMYVEEKNRAWTSGNKDNDYQAITIEVANDEIGGDWHVSDKALNSLIELCIDICKRNDIKELNYTGDSKGNLTRHNMFQATACPGPYLQSKFPYIAEQVNKALKPEPEPEPEPVEIKAGDTVLVNGVGRATSYGTGASTKEFVDTKMKVIGLTNTKRPYRYALNQYGKGKVGDWSATTAWFREEDLKKVN